MCNSPSNARQVNDRLSPQAESHLQVSSGCWENHFPVALGLWALISCWLLTGDHLQLLETRHTVPYHVKFPNLTTYFIKGRWGESLFQVKSCHPMHHDHESDIPSSLPCSTGSEQVTGLTTFKGKEPHKGIDTSRQRLWGPS